MSTVLMTAPAAVARPSDPFRCVAFTVHADADPGTLPRVLELFAKRGLVPTALSSRLSGDRLAMEVEAVGLARAESDHIGNCLRQIPMVTQVFTAERTVPAELLACAE
jgi:prephenate dehydratase